VFFLLSKTLGIMLLPANFLIGAGLIGAMSQVDLNRLVEGGFDDGGRLKKMLIHCIDAEDEMSNLGVSSKLNVGREFLGWLFELGRKRADAFLCDHFDKIGKDSSTSIQQRFL